jgi:hypothetical protein
MCNECLRLQNPFSYSYHHRMLTHNTHFKIAVDTALRSFHVTLRLSWSQCLMIQLLAKRAKRPHCKAGMQATA